MENGFQKRIKEAFKNKKFLKLLFSYPGNKLIVKQGHVLDVHNDSFDFKDIKDGDIIRFTNEELGFRRVCTVEVTEVEEFATFEDCLERKGLKKTLPTITDMETAVDIYYEIYGDQIKPESKVLCWKLKTLMV